MGDTLKIALAQLDFLVGDVRGALAGGILATSQATSALPLVPRVPGNPRNRR